MDEFSAIADDLNAWENRVSTHAPRSHRTSTAKTVSPAVARLQSELQHLAVLVCVMTSAANALEGGSKNPGLAAIIADFCPRQPFTAAAYVERLAGTMAAEQILDEMQELQVRLSFAQALTRHLDGKFRRESEAKASDAEILADAWRRVSTGALAVIMALRADSSLAIEPDNSTLVTGFLKNCIGGGSPCLTDDGALEIPGWAERRSATRVAVQQTAQASTGGDYFEVSVLNASTIGLGLTGEAKNGEHTTVLFPDGRRISGTVKWSEEGRFGLQLDQPLAKSDRLLASA